jgi:hypothetical protein
MKLLFAFIAGLFFQSFAHATLTPNDFYCMEFTVTASSYTKSVFKNCKAGMEVNEGMCSETVRCIPLQGSYKAELRKLYPGKDIFNLSEEEKRAYFKTIPAEKWVPTTLTCKGKQEEGHSPVCPLPDHCKGDMFFDIQVADFDQTETAYKEIIGRMQSGQSQSFPVNQKTDPSTDDRVQKATP